ncbi:hypothetical protein HAX54_042036 [Datura stramonium]|uniref:Uncharacterized protein n=1 Tax=Datura stramonium TaxID=4076 RepID=A0ABS8W2I2_DATST|nr:hypothetical protein [Datura stramonium]
MSPSTKNNLPPTTATNPPNPSPIYTHPQSQSPTYTTYATPPNPPPINQPNQPPTHIPHISLPGNTYPPPATTPVNPPNPPLANTSYNPRPPPIQNTPTIKNYPAQHIQETHVSTLYVQHIPPIYVMETQTISNPISVRFQPEVDHNEGMEKDAKENVDDVLPDIDLPVGYKPPKIVIFNRTSDPIHI